MRKFVRRKLKDQGPFVKNEANVLLIDAVEQLRHGKMVRDTGEAGCGTVN